MATNFSNFSARLQPLSIIGIVRRHLGSEFVMRNLPLDDPLATGRWAAIRELRRSDLDWIRRLIEDPGTGPQFRFAGMSVSPGRLATRLWTGVALQFVAVNKRTNEPIGIVQIYNHDRHSSRAFVAAAMAPHVHRAGWPLEAVRLSIDRAFRDLNIDRLYFETTETHRDGKIEGLVDYLRHEMTFESRQFIGGQYADVEIYSLNSRDWQRVRDPRVRPSGDSRRRFSSILEDHLFNAAKADD